MTTTDTISGICAAIDAGDDSLLPILADALEEAGRADEAAIVRTGKAVCRDGRWESPPQQWKSVVYRSRHSRIVEGHLTVEGRTREAAVALLRAMASVSRGCGSAAHQHARDVVAGEKRTALVRINGDVTFAAKDGTWRQQTGRQLRAYARWDC